MNDRDAAGQRKGVAIASLVLGILSIPTLGLLLVGALLGIILGVVALVKASQEPAVYGGKGIAIAGIAASVMAVLLTPFLAGIIAAFAVPSLVRRQIISSNETAAVADLRALQAAEEAYRKATGEYGRPECLAAPSRCVTAYRGPAFLDARAAARSRAGYVRVFMSDPGTPLSSAWALVAIPVVRNRTGVRAFCADHTGRICASRGGTPSVSGGRCGDPCQDAF